MAVSKNRPKYKVKKKKTNIKKQKLKEMANEAAQGPITFVYHKDRNTVEVPLKEWQTLNQTASRLQDIALFVATMEQVGRQHMTDGTLLPVFSTDIEPSGRKNTDGSLATNPDGSPEMKIKDSFYSRPYNTGAKVEKPLIVQADGKTIYDGTKTDLEAQVEASKL